MIIRPVEPTDKPVWLSLRKALWPKVRRGDLKSELNYLYKTWDKNPIFVAETNDKEVVGLIEVSIHKNVVVCETENVGYIEGWYVLPKFQRMGIGQKLVEAAEQWAISKGCQQMASDTDDDYPNSIAAHEKAGFETVKEEVVYFRKWLK